ncbi:unnamed protein product [Rotaria sp. Silwood1]|nr:unnamed protein product [Rotaria sp. Silwood1]CAF3526145.1 unnamed protein product [Rotaria sp. Silwood1]CAF3627880.1 unnamed protein product [Rotaria sp. Silwood1]CAF4732748.1 unnamed protein product [Rotaria sp. Silwood1]CAF4924338.1 unnamed protein product [Rotaria sp. Silwood1]
MSSSHCLGKSRDSRRERVSIRRATVSNLANGSREIHSLIDAVNAQDYDRVLDLLQSDVDPRTADKYGRTPLHVASTKINAAIVKTLIDHGADVNAEDSLGNTPLHLACISSRLAIVGVLLRAGANLSSTKSQTTPLTNALSRLQLMMNEKRTISSPDLKAEIIELIRLLKNRTLQTNENNSISNLSKKKHNDEQQSTTKTLFLIRHGQSIANRDYDESSAYRDAGLTEQGFAQAKALQKELEELQIDLAIVSPLTRALQTCQSALPTSYSGPILVLPEVAEICSSHYSCGQKRSVIQPKFPNRFDWSNVPIDDIWWWPYDQKHCSETNDYQRKRIEKFRRFIQERPEKRIAVFSHGDYLWDFLEGRRPYPANCQVIPYKI